MRMHTLTIIMRFTSGKVSGRENSCHAENADQKPGLYIFMLLLKIKVGLHVRVSEIRPYDLCHTIYLQQYISLKAVCCYSKYHNYM